jgi:xanthine dehydrogenase accessory factor
VFIDPVRSPEPLWIFGAGHVARALAAASRGLAFDVTVFEDREDMADVSRLEGARRVVRTDIEYRTHIPAPDAATYCVVLTRSHRTDLSALRAAISGTARWVGMIGSARKRLAIYKELQEAHGVSAETLAAVECPVGLSIGAETPEEIAISILARLIQVRRTPSSKPS